MQAFGILGFKTGDIVALTGNMISGEIREKENQLEKARELGKNII